MDVGGRRASLHSSGSCTKVMNRTAISMSGLELSNGSACQATNKSPNSKNEKK